MLGANVNPRVVQEMLGHANLIELGQLTQRAALEIHRDGLRPLAVPQLLGLLVGEVLYHPLM
jgi:hypothetical protein